jgi:hypothetical protein
LEREALRRKFRPPEIRILFVGESPPASGRFFYQADSGLYRAMREAFHAVYPSLDDENFLALFQSSGCYLVDLCPDPVDDLNPKSRREICRASERSLAEQIIQLQPSVMVSLLRSIEGNVMRAASCAKWRGTLINVPYPGRWAHHRKAFVNVLVPVLREGREVTG